MKRYYANLLGNWVDITDAGTVGQGQKPSQFFEDNLTYGPNSTVADCFKYDYIHIQYVNKDYRIHPSMIQIVTE